MDPTHINPQLRVLATRADRTRDEVARLVQVLGADPLGERTRLSLFPWSVFLEQYNTVIHNITDLSTTLSSHPTFHQLFIHPSHALPPHEQTALYGGPGATHDPPLRPIPGKPYADARNAGYAQFADEVEALVTNKLPTVADDALKDEYHALSETAKIIRQTDEHVNFTLLDPPTTSSAPTIEQQLSTTQQFLTHLSGRVGKAQDVLKGLRGGFEWTTRLDPGWSVVEAAKEEAREEEEDADGSEDEDEDEEFEEVAPETARSIPSPTPGSPRPPASTSIPPTTAPTTSKPASEVIDLDMDDDDDDLFGENDSSATGTMKGTPTAIGAGDDDDEEMDQVA